MVIFKHTLLVQDTVNISMKKEARILSVQNQHNKITLWVMCEEKQEDEIVSFSIYGTGHTISRIGMDYIGTVQMDNGLVWHVFKNNM